jgi:hypothetical protein
MKENWMINARRLFVAVMGALMGAAGAEHGVGELLQGNVAPQSIMIRSWPESPFFQSLGGEPAMTILPDMLLTGVLAISFSLLFVGWSIFWAARKNGGLVMMLLAVPLLLFGGGIFPPVLGAIIGAGVLLTQGKPDPQPLTGFRRWFGEAWPWIFAACCIAWLALFPGIAVLGYFFEVDDMRITLASMVIAFVLLFLAFWSGTQHDRLTIA